MRRCQLDDFEFQSSLNFVNLRCKEIEMRNQFKAHITVGNLNL